MSNLKDFMRPVENEAATAIIGTVVMSPHSKLLDRFGGAKFDQVSCSQGPDVHLDIHKYPKLADKLREGDSPVLIPYIPALDPRIPYRIVADLT